MATKKTGAFKPIPDELIAEFLRLRRQRKVKELQQLAVGKKIRCLLLKEFQIIDIRVLRNGDLMRHIDQYHPELSALSTMDCHAWFNIGIGE